LIAHHNRGFLGVIEQHLRNRTLSLVDSYACLPQEHWTKPPIIRDVNTTRQGRGDSIKFNHLTRTPSVSASESDFEEDTDYTSRSAQLFPENLIETAFTLVNSGHIKSSRDELVVGMDFETYKGGLANTRKHKKLPATVVYKIRRQLIGQAANQQCTLMLDISTHMLEESLTRRRDYS